MFIYKTTYWSRLLLFLLGSSLLAACSGGKTAGPITFNNKCDAGQVKLQGECLEVCASIVTCAMTEICSADGVCIEPTDGKLPPRLISIDGDGANDMTGTHAAHHIAGGLVIMGANFTGVTVALAALDAGLDSFSGMSNIAPRAGASSERFEIDLPEALQSGKYTLTVSNQSGSAEATVFVLQGQAGPQGVAGAAGSDGANGDVGPVGPSGSASVNGAQGELLFVRMVGSNGEAMGANIHYDETTKALGVGVFSSATAPAAQLAVAAQFTHTISGDVSVLGGNRQLNWASGVSGKSFLDELQVGDEISIEGEVLTVDIIVSATEITLLNAAAADHIGKPLVRRQNALAAGNDVGAPALVVNRFGTTVLGGGNSGDQSATLVVNGDVKADSGFTVGATQTGTRLEHGQVVLAAVGGTTGAGWMHKSVVFATTFTAPPTVVVSLHESTAYDNTGKTSIDFLGSSNSTSTGFDIDFYDTSGTGDVQVNWIAVGN